MPIDEDLFLRAHKGDRKAVEALFTSIYPTIHRIAHAHAGREDVARGILNFVLARAVRQVPNWRDPESAERWFYHHTILTARRAALHQAAPRQDLLLSAAEENPAPYIAFVRALRGLPLQQQEAFLLHHGERLAPRTMGIAMDCSTNAADTHLQSATAALEKIAGQLFPALTQRLSDAYQRLTPPENAILPSVRSTLRRRGLSRTIKRLFRLALLIIILVAIYYLWKQFGHLLPGR
jgi:DNA-directed RNA polymerase specialized sigma24 family protein